MSKRYLHWHDVPIHILFFDCERAAVDGTPVRFLTPLKRALHNSRPHLNPRQIVNATCPCIPIIPICDSNSASGVNLKFTYIPKHRECLL